MTADLIDDLLVAIRPLAARQGGLRLLVLYGSRARRQVSSSSDWDLGYIAQAGFDPDALLADIGSLLKSDRIDLVDLNRASGQLRYRVAREGQVVFAEDEIAFSEFWLDAVSFWCDAQPIIRAGYQTTLEGLPR